MSFSSSITVCQGRLACKVCSCQRQSYLSCPGSFRLFLAGEKDQEPGRDPKVFQEFLGKMFEEWQAWTALLLFIALEGTDPWKGLPLNDLLKVGNRLLANISLFVLAIFLLQVWIWVALVIYSCYKGMKQVNSKGDIFHTICIKLKLVNNSKNNIY